MVTPETIRALILTEAEALGPVPDDPATLPDDFDLRINGVIDSLGFLELVTALEDNLGVALDLGDMPPDELTVLGPLSRAVALQVAAHRGDGFPAEARS
jgi:acyl carrier protein